MFSRKNLIYLLLLGIIALAMPVSSHAGVIVSVRIGPPVLPVYVQPPCPAPGYLWTPGYWAYGDDGYYWVPGAWVEPPVVGVLWTPGYWGWGGGLYVWHPGYWGPHVGFYGGINYGFGYGGVGFVGGVWSGGVFRYNTAVSRVDVTVIHNTYIDRTVIHENVNHVSFNGGAGGVRAFPSAQERGWEHERHFEATAAQNHHMDMARGDRNQLYATNHGRPNVAASPRAGVFQGRGVQGSGGNFNRGVNNNNRGFNNNNGGFKGGAQGGNRNFDRNAQNGKFNNNGQGGNRNFDRNAQNGKFNNNGPRGNNNVGKGNAGHSEQHASNNKGEGGGEKRDHR